MGMNSFSPTSKPQTASAQGSSLYGEIARIEEGYPFRRFEQLAQTLEITQKQLAETLDISSSTLSRRRATRLSASESSRLYQIQQLLDSAERCIGDLHDARRWLRQPNPYLGSVPLELASTAPGLETVARYLQQISDGVYV